MPLFSTIKPYGMCTYQIKLHLLLRNIVVVVEGIFDLPKRVEQLWYEIKDLLKNRELDCNFFFVHDRQSCKKESETDPSLPCLIVYAIYEQRSIQRGL